MASLLVECVGPSQLRDKTCLFCLSEIKPTEVALQHSGCGNGYHRGCLNIWLTGDNCTCPHCRACLKADQPRACIHTRPAIVEHNTDDDYAVWMDYMGDNEWNDYFAQRDESRSKGLRSRPGFPAQERFRYAMNAALNLFYEQTRAAKNAHLSAILSAEATRSEQVAAATESAARARYQLMLTQFQGFCPHPIHETLHEAATHLYQTQTAELLDMSPQARLEFDTSFTPAHLAHNQTFMPEVYFIMSQQEGTIGDAGRNSDAAQLAARQGLVNARIDARRRLMETLAAARARLRAARAAAADADKWQDDPEDPNTVVLMERPDEYVARWFPQSHHGPNTAYTSW